MKRSVKIREEKRRKSIEFWDPQALLCAHEFLLLLLCVCVSFGRTWQESQSERSSTLSLSLKSHTLLSFSLHLLSLTVSVSFVRDALFAHFFVCVCLSFSLFSLCCLHTQTSMDLVRATGASTWNPIMRCGNYEGAPRSSRSVKRWNSDRGREQFFILVFFFNLPQTGCWLIVSTDAFCSK